MVNSINTKKPAMHDTPKRLDPWPSIGTETREGGPRQMTRGGFAFMVTAAAFALLGWAYAPAGPLYDPGENMSLLWYMAAVGLAVFGLHYFREAAKEKQRESKRNLRRNESPFQPWTWDYPWDTEGSTNRMEGDWKHAYAGLAAVILAGTFAAIYFARHPATGSGLAWFGVAYLGAAVACLYFIRRHKKFGEVRLRFRQFPFHTGERMDAIITGDRWLQHADFVRATLRYVDEIYETVGRRGQRSRESIAYEGFRADIEFNDTALGGSEQTHLAVSFDIPADGPTTALHEIPPHYWDVEVEVVSKGVDYSGHFLVPIYPKTQPMASREV